MIRKNLIIIIIVSLFSVLLAQNLSEKKKQLEELNQQISKEEKLIQQKEAQKVKKEEVLQTTKYRKRQADKEVKKLQKSEKNAKQNLDTTIFELNETKSYLENLVTLCEHESNKLVLAHIRSQMYPNEQLDSRFIASIIRKTGDHIKETEGKKCNLEQDKINKNRQYENLIWTRINTKKKVSQYSSQINNLQTNIAQIEREKAKAQNRKKQLEKEAAQLDELITRLQSDFLTEDYSYKFPTEKLIWPVKGEIIRGYGEQKSDEYKVTIMNNGIDIKVDEGTKVVAVEGGVVAFSEWYNGAGKLVIIDHRNGYYSLYSHNSTLLVSKGDEVEKSQQISLTGKTGSVEIPSLHFELRRRGTPVNPMDYLE